ncbi:MAG: PQQ-binding-like beta-propeller repeat protein [Bdellovibrionales bacterium]|nr:PQQ-binding-like beta-propeller repeat protein [Bdellovibrionales bacterium]
MNKFKLSITLLSFFIVSLVIYKINSKLLIEASTNLNISSNYEIWSLNSYQKNALKKEENKNNKTNDFNDIYYRQDQSRSARFYVDNLKFDLKKTWSSEKLNVGIHGASKASPVSDGELIFVGSDASWFYCFDILGKIKWKFYFANSDRGIHSTALIDQEAVYIGSYSGAFYKINKRNGVLIWSRILGQTIGASPLSAGEHIIISEEMRNRNGYLVKINKNTGEIIWKSELIGEQSHSSPAYDNKSNLIYIGANNSSIQAFDFETGRRVFFIPVKGEIKSTPVIERDHIYFTTWGGEIVSLKIGSGVTRWNFKMDSKSQVSPVVFQRKNLLIGADSENILYALDLTTGKLRWKKKFDLKNNFNQISSPIVLFDSLNNERILFYCKLNYICLIDENGEIGSEWEIGGVFSGVPFWNKKFLVLSLDEGGLNFFSVVSKSN